MTRTADDEFVRFVEECSASLRRTAWLLTGDVDEAADLLQTALLRTFEAWRRIRINEASGYCRKVMATLAIDRWRRKREIPVAQVRERITADAHAASDQRDELVHVVTSSAEQRRFPGGCTAARCATFCSPDTRPAAGHAPPHASQR